MNGASLPEFRSRAMAIAADLTIEQCLRLISGANFWSTAGIPGLVGPMLLTDGPHGLRKQISNYDRAGLDDSVPATCFPVAAALAASWDTELLYAVGRALGIECRAEQVAMLLGPGLNLKRHPRGGRNFEYFSEDPLLSGYLAAAMINGIQSEGVAACPKHFAANNQETSRMVIDTIVDERTLRDFYLRAFEYVMERSKPRAIMAAYNRLNGSFCAESHWLLNDLLRTEWGFDGVVISDWGAVNSGAAALNAGLDLEMPGNGGVFAGEIRDAIESGALEESALRAAAGRMVEFAVRGAAVMTRDPHPVDFAAHHDLARRAAAAGTVLLTNDGTLPLSSTRGLALIGSYADDPLYQGSGSSRINPTQVDSLRAALADAIPYADGYDSKTGEASETQIAAAVELATQAESVVMCVGVSRSVDTEGSDRKSMRLSDSMEQLIRRVCAVNHRVIVAVFSGASLELDWTELTAAVLFCYLGGQASGSALANILTGAVEPTGRLAESFPVRESDLPASQNFPGMPRQVQYREGQWIGYRFHEAFGVAPRFAFGHGLGYTTWAITNPRVESAGDCWRVVADVMNVGQRAGASVVQVYLEATGSERPTKELAGFARVDSKPWETQRIEIRLEPKLFTVWDSSQAKRCVIGGTYKVYVGFSVADIAYETEMHVPTVDEVTAVAPTTGPVVTDQEFERMLGRPIPEPEDTRPFTRTSILSDLKDSRLGRSVLARINSDIESRNTGGEDGHSRALAESTMAGLPIRALATLGGALRLEDLDALIAGMNRDADDRPPML